VNPDSKSQTAISLIGPYKETEVVDEYTVIVRFNTPFAPFLDSISQPYLGIVSPSAVQSMGADFGQTTIIATGPFKIDSYIPDSEVVLVRNDDYTWGSQEIFGRTGPSDLTRFTFKLILEPATRLAALESNVVDFIDAVSPFEYSRLNNEGNFTMVELPQPGNGWSLLMNVNKAPTDDLVVRRAIALASDKQGMIDTVFNGFGIPGCSPLTNVMLGYDATSCNYLPYNPQQAESILDSAGWMLNPSSGIREKDGMLLEIDHYYRADNPLHQAMATFMQADLAMVGILVNLNGRSQAGYFDGVRSGAHNTQNWWDTQTDPDGVVRTLFYSANAGGGTNRSNYVNPVMDELIDAAAATSDTSGRAALYGQIQQLVADDAVMISYSDSYLLFGSIPSLTGIQYLGGGTLPNFYGAFFSN
jgi:peptide/nickel transport system substrate-binding protein